MTYDPSPEKSVYVFFLWETIQILKSQNIKLLIKFV